MDLRDYLQEIASTYDKKASTNSPAQHTLRNAKNLINNYFPTGLIIHGKGGDGTATLTPWIGFFDPDETKTSYDGLYALYIYAEHLKTVTLAINHGVTRLREELDKTSHKNKTKELRRRLRESAELIRAALPESITQKWDNSANLASKGLRQRDYEAGFVIARTYDTKNLPNESELRADLWEISSIYQKCILIRREIESRGADPLTINPGAQTSPIEELYLKSLDDFHPKDASDYRASLQGYEIIKQRRHESMLAEYVPHMRQAGFEAPGDIHPRDLVLNKDDQQWLVEAKVVYNGNTAKAARETIGQLLDYSYFLHDQSKRPRLVGLFTEHIGNGYVGLLNSINVATVWKSPDGWQGCELADRDDLIPRFQ
ncbi:hypothetical protein GCM10027570_52210 [Streptomonospora sediminis]